MAIEELIIKIVSDFDDTGFEKLEKSQSDAEKSTKKLSLSLKNILSSGVTGIFSGDLSFLQDGFEDTVFSPSAENFAEKISGTSQRTSPEPVQTKPVQTKLAQTKQEQAGLTSYFYALLDGVTSGIQKLFFPAVNFFPGGFSLLKENPRREKTNKFAAQIPDREIFGSVKFDNFSEITKPFYFFESGKSFSELNFQNSGSSYKFSTSGVSKLLKEIVHNISSSYNEFFALNTEASDPFISGAYNKGAGYFESNNSTQNITENTGAVTLNITDGAIQINTASENPEAVGEAVREALTGALEDFILKRGYGGAAYE